MNCFLYLLGLCSCVALVSGIFNGKDAHQFVWDGIASMQRKDWNAYDWRQWGYHKTRCGGFCIAKNAMITAAHCLHEGGNITNQLIKPWNLFWYIGQVDVMTIDEDYWFKSGRFYEHQTEDIALVQLWKNVDFDKLGVQPAKLPDYPNADAPNKEMCFAVGFGYNEKGELPKRGQQMPAPHVSSELGCPASIDKGRFCAGHVNGGPNHQSPCGMDSGSPLYCLSKYPEEGKPPEWKVYGALKGPMSYGNDSSAECGKTYGVYVSTIKYADWIRSHSWIEWEPNASV